MRKSLSLIFVVLLVFFIPFFLRPEVLVERGNDLSEFFWPLIFFVKANILIGVFPLWNNLFFSGMPLVADPQSPLFYFPNLIHLLLPLKMSFPVLVFLHFFLSAGGVFFLCKRIFASSNPASLTAALIYSLSPRVVASLEAGHVGLVYSWAWVPWAILSAYQLAKNRFSLWSVLFAFFHGLIFFSHTLIFLLTLSVSILIVIYQQNYKLIVRKLPELMISILLTFGLAAIAFLPQLAWLPKTTRFLLLADRDVYPKWEGIVEVVQSILFPLGRGVENFQNLDTEKVISIGLFPFILALVGFWRLQRKSKILFFITGGFFAVLSFSNTSPFYEFLLSQDWFVLLRVATRGWFMASLLLSILVAVGLDILNKFIGRKVLILAVLAIIEIVIISQIRQAKPIGEHNDIPKDVYELISSDRGKFRVFCVTRCIPQTKAAEYGFELAEGYNTIQQKNYYEAFIQISQVYWSRYTLTLPPFEIYKNREIQPYAPALSQYNIKYVIAPYRLNDNRLVLVKEIGGYNVYKNTIVRSRAFFDDGTSTNILSYNSNKIVVDTSLQKTNKVILSEIYNQGWQAYLNGEDEVEIAETVDAIREVQIKGDTKFVNFVYNPLSYQVGLVISISTGFFVLACISKRKLLFF